MKLAKYFLAISHSDYAKWRQNRCAVILQKPIVIITALWNISPTLLKHFLYRQGINIFVSISVHLHWHLPFKKTHYPLPRTTFLPPLSKVRCCRPKKFGRLPEGLPHHYHSLRTNPTNTALSLAQHHILASLVKGRWIDGKAQTVALLRFNCISTPFLSPNLFAVKTEGLLHPLAPHQPFQNLNHQSKS